MGSGWWRGRRQRRRRRRRCAGKISSTAGVQRLPNKQDADKRPRRRWFWQECGGSVPCSGPWWLRLRGRPNLCVGGGLFVWPGPRSGGVVRTHTPHPAAAPMVQDALALPLLYFLTVLAWGNSIGDLVADLSVARAGSPNMAVTACFAGPLFNMLVGLGVSFFVQCAATGGPVRVDYSTGVKNTTLVSLTVSFVGLAGILCATALAGGVGGFRLRKWWIWPLMGYYSSYMLAEVIIAFVQGN